MLKAGGPAGLMGLKIALALTALWLALDTARRRGATPAAVLLIALPCAWALLPASPTSTAGGDPPGSPPVPPVWRPGSGAASCVGLLDGEPRGPRELRQVIEAFGAASAGCAEALLCFPGTPGAWQEMERAQVIAGLLGG